VPSAPTVPDRDPAGGTAPAAAAPAGDGAAAEKVSPVTVTVTIDGTSAAGRDQVLAAVRELLAAAGPAATVALGGAPGSAIPGVPGAISLDPRPRTAARDGWPLQLSRLEYDLLLFLARNPRQVFSRKQLLTQVWGHTHTTVRTVDVHVSRLRTKLRDQDLVTTVYGLGYRLADDAAVTVVE
jgi:DNA-binding response OmpR family regulator